MSPALAGEFSTTEPSVKPRVASTTSYSLSSHFSSFLKLWNVSGMQNSTEENIVNTAITVNPQSSLRKKMLQIQWSLPPWLPLLSPFIPLFCLHPCPLFPFLLHFSSSSSFSIPSPTLLHCLCYTLLPHPSPLLLFFLSSPFSFSLASSRRACRSVIHSFGCLVSRMMITQYLLELPLLQTLGYLPCRSTDLWSTHSPARGTGCFCCYIWKVTSRLLSPG